MSLTCLQLLSSSFLQGADADTLGRIYEEEVSDLVKWKGSPAEITTLDWRGHLGCRGWVAGLVSACFRLFVNTKQI